MKQPHWRGWEEKMLTWELWKWSESVGLTAKGTAHEPCAVVEKAVFRGVRVSNSTASARVSQIWSIMWMDGAQWDPCLSLLEGVFIDKQE